MAEDLKQPGVGLLPIVHALDALFELVKTLPSPIPPDDALPLVERARVLGVFALQRMTEDESAVIQSILHPDFFRTDTKPEYPPFVVRASIAILCGYIRGCIAQQQLQMQQRANAEAYAAAKIKEERGVGFARPTS